MRNQDRTSLRAIPLQPARSLARVLSGIATLAVVIVVGLVALAASPGFARHQVSELELIATLAGLGALVYVVQHRVAGPRLVLEIGDDELRLLTRRNRRLLSAAPLERGVITRAAYRAHGATYRGYVIAFPDRRLSLGVLGGERPEQDLPELTDPTHFIDPSVEPWISSLA